VSDAERLPRHLTTDQVAKYFGVAGETVRGWRKQRQGPKAKRFGGSVRYPREEVWAYEEDPAGYDAKQALEVNI
jgi:excisionase family DNA binding protein